MRTSAAIAVAVAALCGCGGDEAPSRPAGGWSSARIDGLSHASAVVAWRGTLLFASSSESALATVPIASLADGATVRARAVPLDVDAPRTTFLLSAEGAAREFRLGDLWAGPQAISGLAVADGPAGGGATVVYALSESYRIVWFGALRVDDDGAPVSCTFERAVEVAGASRTHTALSDWRDDPSSGGLAGLCLEGDDLVALERGRGQDPAGAIRLDRISGTAVAVEAVRAPEGEGDGAAFEWGDLVATSRGYLAARAGARGGAPPSTRIWPLLARGPPGTRGLGLPVAAAGPVLADVPPADDRSGGAEGLAVLDGVLYVVSGSGAEGRPTILRWRRID